jgi:hypothetical protein
MQLLAIIGSLEPGSAVATNSQHSMETMVTLLSTPPSFWVVIILGIVASPWMVRPQAHTAKRRYMATYIVAALIFVAAILMFHLIRDRFISIFADLLGSPEQLFIFPFVLGACPLGAVLLVLSWYYVHPVPRIKESADGGVGVKSRLTSFAPMIFAIILFGIAIVFSLTMRLLD